MLNKNWAKVIDKIVIDSYYGSDEWAASVPKADNEQWIEWTESNPAVIGGDYVDGYFYPINHFSGWIRQKGSWVPPTPCPKEGAYTWDNDTQTWVDF